MNTLCEQIENAELVHHVHLIKLQAGHVMRTLLVKNHCCVKYFEKPTSHSSFYCNKINILLFLV